MKRLNYLFSIGVISLMMFGLVACDDDDDKDDNNDPEPININQSDLNGVDNMIGEFTGTDIQDFGHPGLGDETIRVVYTNFTPITKMAEPGDIIAKNTYMKTAEGEKGDLMASFVMVKREAGYNAEGGDWEWMNIGFDDTNDYTMNPFGVLPAAGAANRGMLAGCIDCHTKEPANSDLRFIFE